MNIILLGAPGAGKGTQGQLLSENLGIPWISIGELFREEIAQKTLEGQRLQKYLDKGLNVPGDLTLSILNKNIKECKNGFILDNYPRSIDQLNTFRDFVKRSGLKFDKAIHLLVKEDTSIRRLVKRAKLDEKTKNRRRIDETPKLIRIRIRDGYKKDIEPIRTYFKRLGILYEINGEDTIKNVQTEILKIIKR